jgi:DNA-directed RNA polymerase specialized sigma24 family protein
MARASFDILRAMELDDLVVAARAGDRQAMKIVLTRATAIVRGFLRWRCAEQELDDLSQTVVARVMPRLHSYRVGGGRAFESWVRGIARNVLREAGAHQQRDGRLGRALADVRPSSDPSPSALVYASQRRALFDQELTRIDDRLSRVLEHVLSCDDLAAFAESEGITLAYARVLKTRAVAVMSERLRACEKTPSSIPRSSSSK